MKKRKTHFEQVPLGVAKKIAIEEAAKGKLIVRKPGQGSGKKRKFIDSWELPAPHASESNV